jgi:DNA-binding GntR family transcriptional regulator
MPLTPPKTPLQAAKPDSQREQAYGSFTQHLLAHTLRPGQFVSQRELVELTGLGLSAIRELIPRLETEGLIKTIPKRGMQIAHVDLNLIRDAFEFRLCIETEAIARFTREAPSDQIGKIRAQHQVIIEQCQGPTDTSNIPDDFIAQAQAVDWGFHTTIVDALSNRIISDAYRVNMIKIRLIKQEQTQLSLSVLLPTMQEHMRVIDALEARDCDQTAALLRTHIISARNRALEQR